MSTFLLHVIHTYSRRALRCGSAKFPVVNSFTGRSYPPGQVVCFIEKSNDNFVVKWSRTPRRTHNSNISRGGIDRTTTTLNSKLKHEHHIHHSSVAQKGLFDDLRKG